MNYEKWLEQFKIKLQENGISKFDIRIYAPYMAYGSNYSPEEAAEEAIIAYQGAKALTEK